MAGADVYHYLRIAGTGTPETVLITGGTCTSGASSGTIVFTSAYSHSAWTVQSDSGGLREAILANPNGANIVIPSNTSILVGAGYGIAPLGSVVVDKDNISISCSGWSSVIKARDNAGVMNLLAVGATGGANFSLSNCKLDGNRANYGTHTPIVGQGTAVLLYLYNAAHHARIVRNELTASQENGIWLGYGPVLDTLIDGNYIHDNGDAWDLAGDGVGIMMSGTGGNPGADDVRVVNNRIEHNYTSATRAATAGVCTTGNTIVITTGTANNLPNNVPVQVTGVTNCSHANVSYNLITLCGATNAACPAGDPTKSFSLNGSSGNPAGTVGWSGGSVAWSGMSGAMGADATNLIFQNNYVINNHNQAGGDIGSLGYRSPRLWTISGNIFRTTEAGPADHMGGIEFGGTSVTVVGNIFQGYNQADNSAIFLEATTCVGVIDPSQCGGGGEATIIGNYINTFTYGISVDCVGGCTDEFARGMTIVGNRISGTDRAINAPGVVVIEDVADANVLADNTTAIYDPHRLLSAWNNTPVTDVGGSYLVTGSALSFNPGTVTSAATIVPGLYQVMPVSGSATITTITPPAGILEGYYIRLLPISGSTWHLGTGGNITKACTAVVGQAIELTYTTSGWWPGC